MDLQVDLHEKEDKSGSQNRQTVRKTDLLGELSHELRTSLNTILGFASLMKDPELSEIDRHQFIDRILANGDHLLQILDDALNFSKIEKGEVALEKVSFNIIDMVYDVVQALKPAADKKSLDIHMRFKTSVPQTITSDPIKARQILTHLLGNVLRDAKGDGFILISIYFDAEGSEPNLFLEVDDSGTGIEELSKLEISFNKTSEAIRPGFMLSQRFAEALGGGLSVKPSELGDGQCFVFRLPCGDMSGVTFLNKRKSPTLFEKVSTHFQKEKELRLKDVKVLLAEDSSDSETVIRLFLEKEGAVLTYAHNGLEAIEAVKVGEFDVILMDIQMPLLDGLEATRQIRHLGFQKPIIALTAQALRDDPEKSLKAGCDAHLSKPVSKDLLIDEIQKRLFH